MTTTMIPPQKCPYCKKEIGTTVSISEEDATSPGQIAICYYCGEVSKFDENMYLVKLEPAELIKILREKPGLNQAQKKILAMGRIK